MIAGWGGVLPSTQPSLGAPLCLEHIVLSHHGKKEYGAPVLPSTPEAIFVAQVDNLDAKTAMAVAAADRGHLKPDQTFSERIWALETKIYRPDPLKPATGD